MRTNISRTTWAALITAAAVGVPCIAWFAAGSHGSEQEAARIEQAPRRQARQEAERIARGLAVRLESLRHSENRRSFLDYEHAHEFPGECSCEPQLRSPLARGPADPLIWAHFQIDEVGQLTLPSLASNGADDAARDSARRVLSDEHAVLEVLECAAEDRLSTLTPKATSQAEEKVQGEESGWTVTVGPFEWHRVSLGQRPALVALRQVSTPAATLAQGFVIRLEALEALLEDSPYPAQLKAGPPAGETEAGIPIEGEPWSVALDASGALQEASDRAARVKTRFRTLFAVGLLAALIGGGLVVGLVAQAERLARQRVRFAASAAHELRTPLAGLRMYGEMLADDSGDAGRRRHYAGRIAGEAERLGRVVSNLLGFSKLERGDLNLQPVAADLAAAVRESLGRCRPALEAGGARIETSIANALPQVRFDRDALHQILQNLLDNAARHGGTTNDHTIHVVLDGGSGGPSLSVIDHGPGVAPAVRDRLFRAFVRHPSPDAPDGLGLGLTLVQALARAQGATVTYSDAEGGGSRFTVTFPAAG
jgi:signal transduction histidine kinase